MKTRERKPSPRIGTSGTSMPEFHLCQVFPLYDGTGFPAICAKVDGRLTVGREADFDNRLQIFDYAASREHFRLELVDDRLFVEDLGSTNGTSHNGTEVQRVLVASQDVIRIADSIFVVTKEPPGADREAEQRGVTVGSGAMARAVARVRKVARDKRCVLVLGETGTGKDIMVRLLHEFSGRSGSLVTVNCATIQETLLETTLFGCVEGAYTGARESAGLVAQAHLGTLFLDELGELPKNLQAKLLRFLETGEVLQVGATLPSKYDVRVAAATNQHHIKMGHASVFRQDLLARLEDEVILLPPLRLRKEEIVPHICRVLRSKGVNPRKALHADMVEHALLYHWPRNIRQLIKSTESAVIHADPGEEICSRVFHELLLEQGVEEDASRQIIQGAPPPLEILKEVLKECNGNVSAVARHFGCHRKQVYRWLERYALPR